MSVRTKRGFTLVEVVFAVAIISATLIGISSLISMGGKQATRAEDEREMASLCLSVRNCVKTFGVPYLRSVSSTKVPVSFGSGNLDCVAGTPGSAYDFATAPKIKLKTVAGEEITEREYGAYFASSVNGVGSKSVKVTVTVTNGTITKTLDFQSDF